MEKEVKMKINEIRKPEFLSYVKVTREDLKELPSLMSNWVKLTEHIKDLNEDQLAKMIILELNDKCRLQIIQKLKAKFSTLRASRETKELMAFHQ